MKRLKPVAQECPFWLGGWLLYHGLHWVAVHYFGSVLPPAFSPATWIGDGVDVFTAFAFLAARDYIHEIVEKKLTKPEPPVVE